ncbi:hypothetical protein [Saliphagus sp. LR7]|uniref:glucosamine inositolphosphorylceramide transferase family protein n=1 Tax=Saliphagus sp. LR7 TaxID=2282654 RepID=UPI000DF7BA8E|nr:hypothetical protein [Saliphagus sp. LR7]
MATDPEAAPVYPMNASITADPSIEPHPDVTNPVLSFEDVTDCKRPTGIADPFLAYENGVYHLFFEVLADDLNDPAIGHAVSDDGLEWQYDQIVLDNLGHAAYPHVFQWRDTWYMAPDSGAGSGIHFHGGFARLYRADTFPTEWTLVARPVARLGLVDPTIFSYKDTWYLIGGLFDGDSYYLGNCLYYADAPVNSEWHRHPASPIHDPSSPGDRINRIARPGGRPIVADDHVDVFFQDCVRRYGDKVRAVRITDLTRETYADYELDCSPIVEAQLNGGWNHETMHHVDAGLAYADVKNVVAVDGSPEDRSPGSIKTGIGLYHLA